MHFQRFRYLYIGLIVFALILGLYAFKRIVLDARITLQPQQQRIEDYIETEVALPNDRVPLVKMYQPASFKLEVLTTKLSRPRFMHFHGDRLFIGSKTGHVVWIDPPYNEPHQFTKLRNYPHSMIIRDGYIYIAQTQGIYRAPYNAEVEWIDSTEFEVWLNYPGGTSHASRTIKIGPDNRLYLSIGSGGNCSDQYLDDSYPEKYRRGGINVIDESGATPKLVPYTTGLRNPVGFDWNRQTDVMYATNNGPDFLGFENPPEYFAKATQGSFHGMPWFQYDGDKFFRTECSMEFTDPPHPMEEVSIPAATFPAHNAPLGVEFFPDHAKATEFIGDALVALHGSWVTIEGAEEKKGDITTRRHPKLVVVKFENGEATEVVDLLTGFQLADGGRWGRPAGVAIGPDGEIYFTSDAAINGLFRFKKIDAPED